MKDRAAWVILVGAVEVLLGALLLLLVSIVAAVAALQESGVLPGPATDLRSTLVSSGLNLVLGVFFVWTGIGTIRLRRWARTLMLSVAWVWLAAGVALLALWLVFLPSFELPPSALGGMEPPAPAVMTVVRILLTLFLAAIYVVLPSALVLVLRTPSIRATVERHDPTVPWTDRVPGSVLSMILTLVYLAVTCAFLVPFGGVPLFGTLLGRGASAVAWILSAMLLAWLARGFYRRSPVALWGTVLFTALATLSATWTFLRVEPDEIWTAMELPEQHVEMLRMSGMGSRAALIAVTALSAVTLIGYALYLRRVVSARPPAS